jgi:hypothetical protein
MISYDLTVNIHHPSSSINHWEDQQISGYTTDHATSCILKIWGLHFSLCLDVPRHHWLAGSSCVQHTPTTHKRRRMDPSGNGIHIMYNYTIYIYIFIIYIYTYVYEYIYIHRSGKPPVSRAMEAPPGFSTKLQYESVCTSVRTMIQATMADVSLKNQGWLLRIGTQNLHTI